MKVVLEIEKFLPEGTTKAQVREWLDFHRFPGTLVDVGANPLVDNNYPLGLEVVTPLDYEEDSEWSINEISIE